MRRVWAGGIITALLAIPAVAAAGGGPVASPLAQRPGAQAGARPNIVMIVVDDMREDELRYLPRTGRLIGDRGVRFKNSFASYPLCCPARASILSGRYAHNHRVYGIDAPYGFTSFDDRSTLATWLQDAGYATILIGKYLNGYGYMPEPGADGGDSLQYVPPGWTDWRASLDGGLPRGDPDAGHTYRYFDTTLSDNGEGFDNYRGKYQTYVYGRLSRRIIEKRAAEDRPFFLYASYTAPHHGLPVERDDIRRVVGADGEEQRFGSPARPGGVKGMFDDVIKEGPGAGWMDPDPSDKPAYLRSVPPPNEAEREALAELARQRAESLAALDLAVARTVAALRASGELSNTVLLFTSDNGYYLGEHGIRQGKTLPYEQALNTPLLMRGPGIPKGERRIDPFMQIDFAPTIAALAGTSPGQPVDGRSMIGVARSGDKGWSRPVLTETGPGSVIRDTDESGRPLDADDPGERDVRWAIGIRTPRYLYVNLATEEEELYDVIEDPQQYVNLVADPDHADVLSLMREQLALMRACDAEECRRPLPRELSR